MTKVSKYWYSSGEQSALHNINSDNMSVLYLELCSGLKFREYTMTQTIRDIE
jgi:hypothetical protein